MKNMSRELFLIVNCDYRKYDNGQDKREAFKAGKNS